MAEHELTVRLNASAPWLYAACAANLLRLDRLSDWLIGKSVRAEVVRG